MISRIRKLKKRSILPISVLIAFLTTAGIVSNDFEISKSLDIYATLFRQLSVHYADDLDAGKMNKVAIDAMLESLDPYTVYMPESDIEDYRFMQTGQLGGIGAWVHQREKHVEISGIFAGSPAAEAGFEVGDIIIEINKRSIAGMKSSEVNKLLQGQAGSEVTITIRKPIKEEIVTKTIKRKDIKTESIPYYGIVDGNIGYIRLNSFTQRAGSEIKEAFLKLKEENKIEGLIIDLRNNGGGLLMEAVNIANIFVKKNELIVSTKGRVTERNRSYKTSMPPVDMDIPLAILINGRSASASEIVAGALQDLDRAVIVGRRSFGKGLVQNVVPLSYNAQLKVTTAKYYIPSGRCIQAIDYFNKNKDAVEVPDSLMSAYKTANNRTVYDGKGIKPDIEIEKENKNPVIDYLIKEYIIFDYVTHYMTFNDKIEDPKNFELSEDAWNEFVKFTSERELDYETGSEKALERFEASITKEKYNQALENEINAVKAKLAKEKKADILKNKEMIIKLITEEIVYRTFYEKGKIINSLSTDMDIKRCIHILRDEKTYLELLIGGYKK